jgi:hypothetical protein
MSLVGASSVDITPDLPVDLNGYILRSGQATGIHDRLLGNILYFEQDEQRAFMISLDILTISTSLAEKLSYRISKELEIPQENILLAAIHTHSSVGGPYLRNGGHESEKWVTDFQNKILKGCRIAKDSVKKARFFYYQAYSAVGINRRKKSRGIDPAVPFVIIKKGRKILAIIINYSCHAVCLTEKNLEISADYVYYLREYLYKKLGQKFPVIFFNGGSGDIDPQQRGSFEAARYTGEKLGEEIYLAYQAYDGKAFNPKLTIVSESFEIPYSWQPTVQEAEKNLVKHEKDLQIAKSPEEKKIAKAFYIWAQDILKLAIKNEIPTSLLVKVSYIQLGEISFFALPLEIFSSISLRLRVLFSEQKLFVVSYGNGYSGYLPDKVAYIEGGYEVEQWHKYNGLLPQVKNAEDYFWEKAVYLKNNLSLKRN